MPTVKRTLLIAGIGLATGRPVLAQHVPATPPSLPTSAGQSSAPGTPPRLMLDDVPLDLGALPKRDTPPSATTADAPATTPSASEGDNGEGVAPATRAEESAAAPARRGRTEHVLFDRFPIQVLLAPGRERLVQFPFVPLIDVPSSLAGRLEVQIIEDTAYLTADSPFPRTRLLAQSIDGGTRLPLDIEAVGGDAVPPMLRIHLPTDPAADDEGAGADGSRPSAASGADMIRLTRYAAQVLYAPSRLIPAYPGVRQEPVERKPVAGLYRGGRVETAPLGAWSSGPLHVTAVRFTNLTAKPIELDMERLRGRWIAATPQHWRLLPQGSEADTTAVYLVSDRPFSAVPLWR